MPLSENETIAYRERWLPLFQVIAMTCGWHFKGPALEQFADEVMPHLIHPEVTTTQICVRVIQNYYQDAPTVQLLRDRQSGGEAAWETIAQDVMEEVRHSDSGKPLPADLVERIVARFQIALIQHTYQARLSQLFTLIVREELAMAH
ncbi:MAG: hypothetical protein IPP13_04350 [Kouleothrix sp.]|jgi:hypothetical protein|nr:hypothetical protein [Kouleothrix sp.]